MKRSPLRPRRRPLGASVLAVLAPLQVALPPGQGPPVAATRVPFPVRVTGRVVRAGDGAPLARARVTLFTPDLAVFHEARTRADGRFLLDGLPAGSFRLGVAALGRAYAEVDVAVLPGTATRDFALAPETEPGRWDVVGDTLPETLDATDIGVLRADGTIFYCHDTTDPIVFDPRTGQKSFPPSSGSPQGCMNGSLLADGAVLFAGGQDGADPGDFMDAIPWVKRFEPVGGWVQLPDMNQAAGRWYPGLARLADGRLLAMGGGMAPDATRSDTCEIFDPATGAWTWTGTMGSTVEFPPAALLYDGRVLRTWGAAPELFEPATGTWSSTGAFVFGQRGYPGHSDHSLLVLTDGRALVVGASRLAQPAATMTELYDPATGTWSAGTSPSLGRMQCEVVYLPDGRVLVQGGDQETTAGPEPNVLGIVRRCDLLEPATMTWRRVADVGEFREYHAVTLLVPDGRVLSTGGTRIKFQYGPTSADVEAWSPPYLFRGVRPEIANPSDATPARGATLAFDVFPATRLTHAVLMGMQSTTHWVDGGVPRRLELAVEQQGSAAQVVLPADPDRLPVGWYLLFGMVDDIPSEALVLRVDP